MTLIITPAMEALIKASWDGLSLGNHSGFGVELYGPGPWSVARRLEAAKLGWIEGGKPNGSDLPGLFFATSFAADLIGLFDHDAFDDPEWPE